MDQQVFLELFQELLPLKNKLAATVDYRKFKVYLPRYHRSFLIEKYFTCIYEVSPPTL